jgi:hypothetical protein
VPAVGSGVSFTRIGCFDFGWLSGQEQGWQRGNGLGLSTLLRKNVIQQGSQIFSLAVLHLINKKSLPAHRLRLADQAAQPKCGPDRETWLAA